MKDLIGDIHGHADKLEELLTKMGYKKQNGVYAHPKGRKVIFVGDYIDRGPKIRETLEIVKSMVENDSAIALMGNHEYNALCFHMEHKQGGHLRKHLIKNIIQHYETIKQFQNKQKEYEEYLEWFKTLPLYYETDNFRAVHACWDTDNINYLKKNLVDACLTDELLIESTQTGSRLHQAIEETLKGKELKLPHGLSFTDKDGTIRTEIRIKWWENPSLATYKSISVAPLSNLPDKAIELNSEAPINYYNENKRNIFFGHYWLNGNPSIYRHNICCLDYSVAKKGVLAAYRLNGKTELSNEAFVWV